MGLVEGTVILYTPVSDPRTSLIITRIRSRGPPVCHSAWTPSSGWRAVKAIWALGAPPFAIRDFRKGEKKGKSPPCTPLSEEEDTPSSPHARMFSVFFSRTLALPCMNGRKEVTASRRRRPKCLLPSTMKTVARTQDILW